MELDKAQITGKSLIYWGINSASVKSMCEGCVYKECCQKVVPRPIAKSLVT